MAKLAKQVSLTGTGTQDEVVEVDTGEVLTISRVVAYNSDSSNHSVTVWISQDGTAPVDSDTAVKAKTVAATESVPLALSSAQVASGGKIFAESTSNLVMLHVFGSTTEQSRDAKTVA